jgi:hypothetical protein
MALGGFFKHFYEFTKQRGLWREIKYSGVDIFVLILMAGGILCLQMSE